MCSGRSHNSGQITSGVEGNTWRSNSASPTWVGQHHIWSPASLLKFHRQLGHFFAAMDPLVYLKRLRMYSSPLTNIVLVTQHFNPRVARALAAADSFELMSPIAESRPQVTKLTRKADAQEQSIVVRVVLPNPTQVVGRRVSTTAGFSR